MLSPSGIIIHPEHHPFLNHSVTKVTSLPKHFFHLSLSPSLSLRLSAPRLFWQISPTQVVSFSEPRMKFESAFTPVDLPKNRSASLGIPLRCSLSLFSLYFSGVSCICLFYLFFSLRWLLTRMERRGCHIVPLLAGCPRGLSALSTSAAGLFYGKKKFRLISGHFEKFRLLYEKRKV